MRPGTPHPSSRAVTCVSSSSCPSSCPSSFFSSSFFSSSLLPPPQRVDTWQTAGGTRRPDPPPPHPPRHHRPHGRVAVAGGPVPRACVQARARKKAAHCLKMFGKLFGTFLLRAGLAAATSGACPPCATTLAWSRSAVRWPSAGHVLAVRWSSAGHVLAVRWSCASVVCWRRVAHVHHVLAAGRPLVMRWARAGRALASCAGVVLAASTMCYYLGGMAQSGRAPNRTCALGPC